MLSTCSENQVSSKSNYKSRRSQNLPKCFLISEACIFTSKFPKSSTRLIFNVYFDGLLLRDIAETAARAIKRSAFTSKAVQSFYFIGTALLRLCCGNSPGSNLCKVFTSDKNLFDVPILQPNISVTGHILKSAHAGDWAVYMIFASDFILCRTERGYVKFSFAAVFNNFRFCCRCWMIFSFERFAWQWMWLRIVKPRTHVAVRVVLSWI